MKELVWFPCRTHNILEVSAIGVAERILEKKVITNFSGQLAVLVNLQVLYEEVLVLLEQIA